MSFFAYIDPGMGLLAWQALVAFCVGLLFYIRKTRTWIFGLFKKSAKEDKPPEHPVDGAPTVEK
jgi:hypothetical protein